MIKRSNPFQNDKNGMMTSPIYPLMLRGKCIVLAGVLFINCILSSTAWSAKYASVVIDAESGRILDSTNADARRYPASLTKIMTLYMVFDALERKKITLKTKMRASRRAAGATPSKLGLRAGDTITVENAILALVTKSANDVATVVAEHLGGTEIAFARLMNAKALQIGMKRTTFQNASGLPNRHQMSTARDMAVLGMRIRKDFPHYYKYFGRTSFVYKGRTYGNHNKLLKSLPGTDGIKTGYIRDSGFNLVASTVQDGHRLIGVVFGGRTGKSRDEHMKKILNSGFTKVEALYVRAPDRNQALALKLNRERMAKSYEKLQVTVAKAKIIEGMIDSGEIQVAQLGSPLLPQKASLDVNALAEKMGVKSLRSPLLAHKNNDKGMIRLIPLHEDASVTDLEQTVATLHQGNTSVKIAIPPTNVTPPTNMNNAELLAQSSDAVSKPAQVALLQKAPFGKAKTKSVRDNPTVQKIVKPSPVQMVHFTDKDTVPLKDEKKEETVPVKQSPVQQETMSPKMPLQPSETVELALADAYITKDAVIDVGYDTRMKKLALALTALQGKEKEQSRVADVSKINKNYASPPPLKSRKYGVGSNNGLLKSNGTSGNGLSAPSAPNAPDSPKSKVQVGAYSTMNKAQNAVKMLKESLGDYANLFDITIDPTAKGNNRSIFRLRMDNVPNQMMTKVCEKVKTKGFGCFSVGKSKY